jgi:cell division protein ZapA (FtsZ GTPase activity inhibitor)
VLRGKSVKPQLNDIKANIKATARHVDDIKANIKETGRHIDDIKASIKTTARHVDDIKANIKATARYVDDSMQGEHQGDIKANCPRKVITSKEIHQATKQSFIDLAYDKTLFGWHLNETKETLFTHSGWCPYLTSLLQTIQDAVDLALE